MKRVVAALAALVLLSACAEPTWAPEAEVQRALYSNGDPPSITLFTVRGVRRGDGAHSGLMVNGAHRALFDPAGTFYHPGAPERNDVHFGVTENVLKVYIDYHARETYDVIVQEVQVSPEVAQRALAEIQAYGAVPKAHCGLAVSRILSTLPGFESMRPVWNPNRISEQFAAAKPQASYRQISDDDADKNHGVLFQAATVHMENTGADR